MVDPSSLDRARKYGLCWSCTMPRADRHHDADYRMHQSPYDIPGHDFVDPPAADIPRADLVARAWSMRDRGHSLFAIASSLGVTKDWLRTYAGLR